jgi:hypothetical protein
MSLEAESKLGLTERPKESWPHGGWRPGSGRLRRNTRQIVLRLSPETIGRLHEAARVLGISMSELAEAKLARALGPKKGKKSG